MLTGEAKIADMTFTATPNLTKKLGETKLTPPIESAPSLSKNLEMALILEVPTSASHQEAKQLPSKKYKTSPKLHSYTNNPKNSE